MTVANNYQPTRQTGNGVTTAFSFNFKVINENQIVVYQRDESGEQTTVDPSEYSVTLTNSGGMVTFNTAPANGVIIAITRDTPQTQETPYKTSQGFPAAVVEGDFDKLTMMVQELQQDSDRSVKVDVTSSATPEELINEVERVYGSIDNIDTVADDITNVNTVAGISADVSTVAGNTSNINTVAGISADVTTTAGISANVTAVAGNATNINTVAGISADVTTVAGISSDVSTVAGISSDVSTVAGDTAAIGTVSTYISSVRLCADDIDSVRTTATNISDVIDVASNATNINNVAADLSSINAVAGDLANIDAASSYAAEAKQWAIGEPTEPSGGSAKYWAGQASAGQVQADWTEADPTSKAYIQNKPTNFVGATSGAAGAAGFVPAPASGDTESFLKSDGTWGAVGGGGEIGDIGIAPLGINELENKRRYLNGQVISQAQFESFTDKLKSIVALYPNLATTEVNWQAEVTNSKLGQCGKFVIDDDASTIRLPKVVNINGLQDLTLLGGIKAESLPNITGVFTSENNGWENGTGTGAFSSTSDIGFHFAGTPSGGRGIIFNASNSSSTYQDDAPVQQEAVQYPYFIQVATGVETSIDVSREIELNNPFSLLDYKYSEYELSNASWLLSNGQWNSGATYPAVYELLLQIYNGTVTKAGVSVKLSTETYDDTDFVLNTGDTTFRLPIKVKLPNSKGVAGNGMALGVTDGTNNAGVYFLPSGMDYEAPQTLVPRTNYYGASVGSSASYNGETPLSSKIAGITTDTTKSGVEVKDDSSMYLYFYVGETIQDANIIAAAGVLTDVADLKARKYIVETYVNGTSWYRVYSDGWCEQGGIVSSVDYYNSKTISFAKTFSDTNYCLSITCKTNSNQVVNASTTLQVYNYSASQANVFNVSTTSINAYWRACGYIS